MDILDGIKNFLQFINDNWVSIAVILGLIVMIWKKVKSFLSKSDEEKIEYALSTIRETMLKFVTDAEISFDEWKGAGSIKRAQVINELYTAYPILSKAIDQDEVIKMIDEAIDEALPTLREIIKEMKKEEKAND